MHIWLCSLQYQEREYFILRAYCIAYDRYTIHFHTKGMFYNQVLYSISTLVGSSNSLY
jgi:hypothetical protein